MDKNYRILSDVYPADPYLNAPQKVDILLGVAHIYGIIEGFHI